MCIDCNSLNAVVMFMHFLKRCSVINSLYSGQQPFSYKIFIELTTRENSWTQDYFKLKANPI